LNKTITKKDLSSLVEDMITKYGIDATPNILDKIKSFGFKYATYSGITWSMSDTKVPEKKGELVGVARKEVEKITEQYNGGLLSDEERYRKTIAIWQELRGEIEKLMPGTLEKDGSVNDMITSGARGSLSQIVQMSGMKGLIVNTAGETLDFPIIPSNKEGLSPLEYFVTTHGSRKGLADTALNTARAGYLTRRLVYVADNAIITEEDCGTKEGRTIKRENISGFDISLSKNIKGRTLAENVLDPKGKVLFKKGTLLSREDANKIERLEVEEVSVRSPLSCKSTRGLCRQCYGIDLGRNELVCLGEPVGIVAAQAIGEPGTQLTMRTFHAGGIASVGGDITMGLPRVEEVFERRTPKSKAVVATADGKVIEIKVDGKEKIVVVLEDEGGTKKKSKESEYSIPFKRMATVKIGDDIKKGDIITDGSADIKELYKYAGIEKTEDYIINEINKIYELQGASISRKHIEVVVRQMFSRSKIKESGDTRFVPGEIVDDGIITEENEKAKEEGKSPAKCDKLVLGITEVSLTTQSFLSAASFQYTSRVLINVAVRGTTDKLEGLKENVIIGRLIPAGTGYKKTEEISAKDDHEIEKE